MVSTDEVPLLEMCERVKKLGYSVGKHIHMCGEQWDVLSDPFPLDGGIAVKVKVRGGDGVRTIKLPETVLQSIRKEKRRQTSS